MFLLFLLAARNLQFIIFCTNGSIESANVNLSSVVAGREEHVSLLLAFHFDVVGERITTGGSSEGIHHECRCANKIRQLPSGKPAEVSSSDRSEDEALTE